jgi:excisionase family DNA binding protein
MDTSQQTPLDDLLLTEKNGAAEGLLSDREAGRILGVGRSTVWRLMETGDLPYVRFRRNRRIKLKVLVEFIAKHSVESIDK